MRKFFIHSMVALSFASGFSSLWAGEIAPGPFRSGAIGFSKDCSASGQDVCAGDRVSAGPGTYLDLLRILFPDIRADGNTSLAPKTPRKNFGQMNLSDNGSGAPASKIFLPAGDFSYLALGEGEKSRVLLLNRSSGDLALFQIAPALKLLDLVGVAQDREVFFSPDKGVYAKKNSGWLFWVANSHHNSGESYYIYNLMNVSADKVELAYDGPFLYSFQLPGDSDCRVAQNLDPVAAFPANESGYPGLAMKVRQEKSCQKASRETVMGRRDFSANLTWDEAKQKYMGGSKELLKLNRCLTEGGSETQCR